MDPWLTKSSEVCVYFVGQLEEQINSVSLVFVPVIIQNPIVGDDVGKRMSTW